MTVKPHELSHLYGVVTRAYFISQQNPVETVYDRQNPRSCFEDDEDDLLRLLEEFHNVWRTIRRSRRLLGVDATTREPPEHLEWHFPRTHKT